MTFLDWITLLIPFTFAFLLWWRREEEGGSLGRTFGVTVDRHTPTDVSVGIAVGAIVMLGAFGTELGLGAIGVQGAGGPGEGWYGWMLFLFVAAGIEEILTRSFLLQGLIVLLGKGKWPAVALSAVFFGAAHLGNPHANFMSVVGNSLGGVMYAVAFLGSGALWMAWALHFSWNFFQGLVFGFPVSGMALPGLVHLTHSGPAWLGGGEYGPEAGAVGIAARVLAIGLMFAWFKHLRPRDSWREVLLFTESTRRQEK